MTEQDWELIKEQEMDLKLKLQKDLCQKHTLPCLVDKELKCPKCFMDILFYYSQKEAGNRHIKSCKLCDCSLLV